MTINLLLLSDNYFHIPGCLLVSSLHLDFFLSYLGSSQTESKIDPTANAANVDAQMKKEKIKKKEKILISRPSHK